MYYLVNSSNSYLQRVSQTTDICSRELNSVDMDNV